MEFVKKKCTVFYDIKNNPIVLIKDIRFKGKRNINWNEVEKYVKEYVGSCYEVIS